MRFGAADAVLREDLPVDLLVLPWKLRRLSALVCGKRSATISSLQNDSRRVDLCYCGPVSLLELFVALEHIVDEIVHEKQFV